MFYYVTLETAPKPGLHDSKQIFGQKISQSIKHAVNLAFILTYAGVSLFREWNIMEYHCQFNVEDEVRIVCVKIFYKNAEFTGCA